MRPFAAVAAAILLSPAAAQAAELPLATQMQVLCLPFADGSRPFEQVIASAQKFGYPNRVDRGVFTDLSGPAGKLSYSRMLDGRRGCEFHRPQSAYRQVLSDLKTWTARLSGGPWTPGPEGPDVEGKRAMTWTGVRAQVEVTEDFDENDDIVLIVGARSKP